MKYNGLGRRNYKKVENSGDWDHAYQFYYKDHSVVEMRDDSGSTHQQYVWGTQYTDELVQIATNRTTADNDCEWLLWATPNTGLFRVILSCRICVHLR